MTGLARDRREAGFTLIELLVVIIIVGVLAAVAIPVYLNQRRKAADGALRADMRAAAFAMESWYVDGYRNADAADIGSGYLYLSSGTNMSIWPYRAEVKTSGFPSINLSPGTGLGVRTVAALSGYCIVAHNKGSSWAYNSTSDPDRLLFYDSLDGGFRTRDQISATGACQYLR